MTSYALCNKYIDDVIYYKLYLINDNTICFRTNPKNKNKKKNNPKYAVEKSTAFFSKFVLTII